MVSRRQLKGLKEAAKQGVVVIETTNGRMEAFSEMAPLALFSLEVDEERAAYKGIPAEEPTTPQQREALRLRQALEDATPESRAHYKEQCREFFEIVEVLRRSREETGTS
jgi:tRNA(Ile)-lysidine synthase TilS/MesJ